MDQLHRLSLTNAVSAVPGARSVVEIGCGGGTFLRALAASFPRATITGVDVSEAALRKATALLTGEPRVELVRARAEDLPLASNSVDVVVANKSFHHWDDWPLGLREIERVLRDGSALVVGDALAEGLIRRRWMRRLTEILDGGRFIDEPAMDRLLAQTGFEVQKRLPVPGSGGALFVTVASPRATSGSIDR